MKENDEYVDEDHKKKYDKSIFIFFLILICILILNSRK